MNNPFINILKGKVVIVGIGNILRGDDGFGPALVEKLKENEKLICIDAGSTPESYTRNIISANPDVILLADAVHLNHKVGEYEILGKNDIVKSGLTTHDISPRMFIEYLESQIRAEIYMVGIQPQNLSLGEDLSEPVKKSLDEIKNLIMEVTNARNTFNKPNYKRCK